MFSGVLLGFLWNLFLIFSISTSVGADPMDDAMDCICPGFKREICSYGLSGNINCQENLCVARCSDRRKVVGIAPRSDTEHQHGDHSGSVKHPGVPSDDHYGDTYAQKLNEEWFKGIKKEAQVWKKVNQLTAELVHLSNGGGPPCSCPAITRLSCSIGSSGSIEKHENLCTNICHQLDNPNKAILIGDLCSATSTINQRGIGSTFDEEKELLKWYKYMEGEIYFYRKVSQAMEGFFLENQKTNKLPASQGKLYRSDGV